MQPEGAISTNCRSCGSYFKLVEAVVAREQKAAKPTPTTRTIVCAKCQTSNRVTDAAMSTQCMKCANYLDLRDQVIRGTSSERVHTYGELTFATGCIFRGFSAEASNIEILGRVASRLEAVHTITAGETCHLSGEMKSHTITVLRGAIVSVEFLTCQKLFIDGLVEVAGTAYAAELVINKGGILRAKQVRARQIEAMGELAGRLDMLTAEE
jgi:cytoskeletal protein CcmA (bactofilin family)